MADYTEIVEKAKALLAKIADYMALSNEDKRLNRAQMHGVCFSAMAELAPAVVGMAEELDHKTNVAYVSGTYGISDGAQERIKALEAQLATLQADYDALDELMDDGMVATVEKLKAQLATARKVIEEAKHLTGDFQFNKEAVQFLKETTKR